MQNHSFLAPLCDFFAFVVDNSTIEKNALLRYLYIEAVTIKNLPRTTRTPRTCDLIYYIIIKNNQIKKIDFLELRLRYRSKSSCGCDGSW